MMNNILDLSTLQGSEALTVGERLKTLYQEISLGIDKLNAKHLNKTIHAVKDDSIGLKLKKKNNYFDVSYKQIQSPVFFNPANMTFQEYVNLTLDGIGVLQLVLTQAEDLYRDLRKTAVSGKVSYSLRNADHLALIEGHRERVTSTVADTAVYTRAISDMYPNWTELDSVIQGYNRRIQLLKSRDVEVLSKQADAVITIAKLVKSKIDSQEITISPEDAQLMNETIKMLADNMQFAGFVISMISETSRVLNVQVDEIKKIVL